METDTFPYEVKPVVISQIVEINNRTMCPEDTIPSIPEYLSAINVYGVALFTVGGAAVLIVLIMYIDTLRYIMKNSPPRVKTHSAFVLGVYPVIAVATYCGIVVPRAHLLAEAVTQGIFMAGMYQLFCLLVAYCGGEAELVRKVKPNTMDLRVGPCCCWPCCCCLPSPDVNKKTVKNLRLLVLQLPVVQGLVYMSLLVMWAERESLYQVNYVYVQPIIIVSILSGIYSMSMTMKMLRDILKDHSIVAKFLVLQMVLLFAKLQALITRIVAWSGALPCKPPITPAVYASFGKAKQAAKTEVEKLKLANMSTRDLVKEAARM
ncbi:uncharacterized protein CBL_01459 [Carabus blaptoides fortunei]